MIKNHQDMIQGTTKVISKSDRFIVPQRRDVTTLSWQSDITPPLKHRAIVWSTVRLFPEKKRESTVMSWESETLAMLHWVAVAWALHRNYSFFFRIYSMIKGWWSSAPSPWMSVMDLIIIQILNLRCKGSWESIRIFNTRSTFTFTITQPNYGLYRILNIRWWIIAVTYPEIHLMLFLRLRGLISREFIFHFSFIFLL